MQTEHPFPLTDQSPAIAGEAVLGVPPDFLNMVTGTEGIVPVSNTIQELDNETHTTVNKILAKGQEDVWGGHICR